MKSFIKENLYKAGMSVTELSDKTNIGRTTISNLVNSDEILSSTKIGTLNKIAEVLGVKVSDLFDVGKDRYDVVEKNKFSKEYVDDGGFFGGYWVLKKRGTSNHFFAIRVLAYLEENYVSDLEYTSYLWQILQLNNFILRLDKNLFKLYGEFEKLSKVANFIKLAKNEEDLENIFKLNTYIKDVTNTTDNYLNETIAGYNIVENVMSILRKSYPIHWLKIESFFVLSVINHVVLDFDNGLSVNDLFDGAIAFEVKGIRPDQLTLLRTSKREMLLKDLNKENRLEIPDLNNFSRSQGSSFVKDITHDLNKEIFDEYWATTRLFSSNEGILTPSRLIGEYDNNGELNNDVGMQVEDEFEGLFIM